jgi:hypothetical protein
MINYSNGKIYKIEAINGDKEDIYVGSTTKAYLCQRMAGHKYLYKKWKLKETHKFTCFDIFDKYGVDNCTITLLETVNSNSKDELLAREAYYVRTLECVNRLIPGRTKKEYAVENREITNERNKKYYEKNKEALLTKYNSKYTCECGSNICFGDKARHNKSKKHIEYLNSTLL